MNELTLNWEEWDAEAYRRTMLYFAMEIYLFVSVGM
jgi:hypothetical protein